MVYDSEYTFCRRFCGLLYDAVYYGEAAGIPKDLVEQCHAMSLSDNKTDFRDLSNFISKLYLHAEKPIVLIIDEVDQASNQETFLSFLGTLRDKYLKRKNRPTFQSVILAGVYDIKNLKLKIREEAEHQYNSPWNIASPFLVDMSFSTEDIAGMLSEYEKDNDTHMDISYMAEQIYEYTMGYPFLVSAICKIMDEQIIGRNGIDNKSKVWSRDGFLEAVKILLYSSNTLFDDIIKHLLGYPELSKMSQNTIRRIDTPDKNRTDVVVDYRGKQYVIEMKIWRGDEYNRKGEEQLIGYLDEYHLKKGYMLTFNFNKKKQTGVQEVIIEDKTLVEVVV